MFYGSQQRQEVGAALVRRTYFGEIPQALRQMRTTPILGQPGLKAITPGSEFASSSGVIFILCFLDYSASPLRTAQIAACVRPFTPSFE